MLSMDLLKNEKMLCMDGMWFVLTELSRSIQIRVQYLFVTELYN